MIQTIQPEQAVCAACPSGHSWDARHRIEDRGVRRREGRRPARSIVNAVTPERCPTCQHHWCTFKPKGVR